MTAKLERQGQDHGHRQDTYIEFFKLAVENSDLGVWVHDIVKDELTWSSRLYELLGVQRGIPPRLDILQSLMHPEDHEWVQNEIGQCLANKTKYSVEYRTIRPDNGETVWLRSTGEALFDARGQSFVMFGSAFDITHLKNAEFKATSADRAKSEFLANMSHEIRTPMNGILGICQVLERTDLTEHQKNLLKIVNRSGDTLIKIINDILDFSRAESGDISLVSEAFSLIDCIEDISTLLESAKSKSPNFELLIRCQPDLPSHYMGDVGRLRQVLINLLSNALKFTEEGHVLLDVRGSVDENIAHLEFTFEDTGIGIPKEKADVIFDKFAQVDNSRTREFGGTGLGLAIAKEITDLMGGSLSFESKLGEGSTFRFEVSMPKAQTATASPPNADFPDSEANILIVDDNPISRKILSDQLTFWNLKTLTAGSAREGLTRLKAANEEGALVDLILLDLEMPKHSGEDFLKVLRKHARFDHIDVILMSAMNAPNLMGRAQALGAVDYIAKPPRVSQLYMSISKYLRQRETARDWPKAS